MMYCVQCRTTRAGKDTQAVTMKNGKMAYKSYCEVCDTTMFMLGAMPLEIEKGLNKDTMWAVEKSGGYWYFTNKKDAVKHGQTISWNQDDLEIKIFKIKILKTYRLKAIKDYKLEEIQ